MAKAKILNMPKKVEELIRRTHEELLLEDLSEEEISEEGLKVLEDLYKIVVCKTPPFQGGNTQGEASG